MTYNWLNILSQKKTKKKIVFKDKILISLKEITFGCFYLLKILVSDWIGYSMIDKDQIKNA